MSIPTPEQVALVNRYLPSAAKDLEADGGYGWTDLFISTIMDEMALSPAQAVRFFWYQRTQETAEYLDIGKPLTQIHRQAKEMLAYWDQVIANNPNGMMPVDPDTGTDAKHRLSFGEIERPWSA